MLEGTSPLLHLQHTPTPLPLEEDPPTVLNYRSIWISDIHLGTRACQAEALLDFINHTRSEYLYLVGDIIDGWQIKKSPYWPTSHTTFIRKVLKRAEKGTKVIYVAGNHDEFARTFLGMRFGDVGGVGGATVVDHAIHTTADSRRLLVLHGDQFDAVMEHARWLAKLGSTAYDFALFLNRVFNYFRQRFGWEYWSLSAYLKHKVKNAVNHIGSFEKFIANAAQHYNVDGVVCGHIHHAEMRNVGDVLYINDGDWVESCTATVEDFQGRLTTIYWKQDRDSLLNNSATLSYRHVKQKPIPTKKKVLVVSDAWHPQVNGVVRTLENTIRELQAKDYEVQILGPDLNCWSTFCLPNYPEIRLDFFGHRRIKRMLARFDPDYVHIATEWPLGRAARNLCLQTKRPFTTAYHTDFPNYVAKRIPRLLAGVARGVVYAYMRRFHAPSSAIMVATDSVEADLRQHKFKRVVRWSRGVDAEQFQPYGKNYPAYANLPRPILLNVGRIAAEKNLPAFLDLKTSGSKVVIGDGPDLPKLRSRYPDVHFLGQLEGQELGRAIAAADLFVFPSKTDTFGLVLLEACAAGLRIASFQTPGPIDIFSDPSTQSFAALDCDMQRAVDRALKLPENADIPCQFAKKFYWTASDLLPIYVPEGSRIFG